MKPLIKLTRALMLRLARGLMLSRQVLLSPGTPKSRPYRLFPLKTGVGTVERVAATNEERGSVAKEGLAGGVIRQKYIN